MKRFYTLFILFWVAFSSFAQGGKADIPAGRAYFHEKIDDSQKDILALDGITAGVNNAATAKIDSFQTFIEDDGQLDNTNKIKFLRGLNEALTAFIAGCKSKQWPGAILPGLVEAYSACLGPELNNQSIAGIISQYPYETAEIIAGNFAFNKNVGTEDVKNILLCKYCRLHPNRILNILSEHPALPCIDSLLVTAARLDPEAIYNYTGVQDSLGAKIRNCTDRLVQTIAQMAQLKTGRLLFPFLDQLYHQKLTFAQVDSAVNDSTKYYALLVKTEIDYADRMRQKDTPMAMQALAVRIAYKAKEIYVNQINALHESPDEVRFKIIDKLSPAELYCLAVFSEEEIYTSSYVRGVYPRLFHKTQKSDSLLMGVQFDHFKKWIKIAANYNTLDDFLKRMKKDNAELLMKAFVKGLDKTNSLEDAVDVANSFAGIKDTAVRKLILNEVQYNLQKAKNAGNKKGTDIYNILNILFLSMDTANHIDVSRLLGIPPVYYVPNKGLQDTSGKIIVQQFFYGDKDGQGVFNSFLNGFDNANWKIKKYEQWTTVSSTHGTPIVIYSNNALDEKQGLDAAAQKALGDYLYDSDIAPVIVIHRGHSYYLPSTLEQLVSSEKIVLLGSCGGYQSLNKVLKRCPTAHIVASKQTGSGTINGPLIRAVMETLRQGKDLNWLSLWNNLGKLGLDRDLFDDYVPPYKNLGALFIMAYNRVQGL